MAAGTIITDSGTIKIGETILDPEARVDDHIWMEVWHVTSEGRVSYTKDLTILTRISDHGIETLDYYYSRHHQVFTWKVTKATEGDLMLVKLEQA